ncbi:type III-A CRISPR-associated protein Cas10/Csm1 [Thermococcus indicus]|uniref:CRISPR system single-strand-specific deoxyribonuclease Cas10/Csm1 (subtype III-A) n=1 Tax=Thermococcus indicus TaxID=2586643 RepID=A0A4Y5SMN6_9EURY|nr:type III-A CRISPR-associated protein Cas10/Csm1 [Thermococcus indicus]QDA31341.1 type III-A CRISPR-associated protein Cas10/Csm1 [Thermococcus indicus]
MDLRELVALGGLLHDVGKPVQRAGLYSGDHSTQGALFLRDIARSTEREEYELLALFSEFHHWDHMENEERMRAKIREVSPERFGLSEEDVFNALWIVYEADNLSSSEREGEGREFYVFRPLASVFSRDLKYPLYPLDFGAGLPMPAGDVRISGTDYRDIIRRLTGELIESPLKTDRLMPLLEKYLSFVSSVTLEGNTISLYDHMRMTSAIALAMLHSGCTVEEVKSGTCKKEKRFLLIEGDFSGIQDFIYRISGKGTLKYLRARSAYLGLLGWDVVLEILRRLNLTRANVIFNAGGHFLIIAQNTPEAVGELEGIRKHVSEWLWNEFDGSLYLALDWEPVTGEELGRSKSENLFERARGRLKKKLAVRKLRRFGEVESLFNVPKAEKLEECPVCGREVPEGKLEPFVLDPEVRVCSTCNGLAELGKNLPKIGGFVFSGKDDPAALMEGPFSGFVPHLGEVSSGKALLLKNTLKPPANLPPEIEFVPYFVADYYRESSKGGIADFEELAEASTGVKRIGVLKGDVDFLGDFFRSMDSPSKLATASRFMDYFFKGYLGAIIKGKFGYVSEYVPSLRGWPEKPDIVVVYAGGDDFFIVGAWDQVFELAFRIRETFRAYTGNGLTLSAGLGYFDPKTPIYRMAEVVGERLEKAKDEGRNRVTVIERSRPEDGRHPLSYTWDEYGELWKRYTPKVYAGNGRLRKPFDSKRGLLMRLLELRELYVRTPNDVRWAYLTAYLLGRHGLSDLFPELVGIDANAVEKNEPQPIYWIDGVLKIVLMAVRR